MIADTENAEKERQARSRDLEQAYVHDVYEKISSEFSAPRTKSWPRVKQFLDELEPGSIVADVGCGNGKYLQICDQVFCIGLERCWNFARLGRSKGSELLLGDNMKLPFREQSVDGCLSIAVIHHLASTERRISALRELARILKIGGKLLITAWSMEQKHRKFGSQDILVPWQQGTVHQIFDDQAEYSDPNSSKVGDDKPKKVNRPSNRNSLKAARRKLFGHTTKDASKIGEDKSRKLNDIQQAYRPSCDSDTISFPCRKHWNSESELASPKDSCYSFVRKALQKLTNARRLAGKKLIHSNSISSLYQYEETNLKNTSAKFESTGNIPIELRHLEPANAKLLDESTDKQMNNNMHEISSFIVKSPKMSRNLKEQSHSLSLSDGSETLPPSLSLSVSSDSRPILCSLSSDSRQALYSYNSDPSECESQSKSSSSCLSLSSRTNISSPLSGSGHSGISNDNIKGLDSRSGDSGVDEETTKIRTKRPSLQKQKESIVDYDTDIIGVEIDKCINEAASTDELKVCSNEQQVDNNKLKVPCFSTSTKIGDIKQSSLNDEITYIDRILENEKIKQGIHKQSSMNEEYFFSSKTTIIEFIKDHLFNSEDSYFKTLKENLNKIKIASLERFDIESSESIKNILKNLINNWKNDFLGSRYEESQTESNETNGQHLKNSTSSTLSSFFAYARGRSNSQPKQMPSECTDKENLNQLSKSFTQDVKLVREESSDSSKENSIQSDTSVDSEESCVSVIFIPKTTSTTATTKFSTTGIINTIAANNSDNSRSQSEFVENFDKTFSPLSPRSPINYDIKPLAVEFDSTAPQLDHVNGNTEKHLKNEILTVNNKAVYGEQDLGLHELSESFIENYFPQTMFEELSSSCLSSSSYDFTKRLDTISLSGDYSSNVNNFSKKSSSYETKRDKSVHSLEIRSNLNKLKDSKHVENSYQDMSLVRNANLSSDKFLSFPNQTSIKTSSSSNSILSSNSNLTSDINTELTSKFPNLKILKEPRKIKYDVFNPETDDLDSDSSTSTTSPSDSENSIIERGWPTEKDISELDKEIKKKEEEEKAKVNEVFASLESIESDDHDIPKYSLVEPVHRMDTITEESQSNENIKSHESLSINNSVGDDSSVHSVKQSKVKTLYDEQETGPRTTFYDNKYSIVTNKINEENRPHVAKFESTPEDKGTIYTSYPELYLRSKTLKTDSYNNYQKSLESLNEIDHNIRNTQTNIYNLLSRNKSLASSFKNIPANTISLTPKNPVVGVSKFKIECHHCKREQEKLNKGIEISTEEYMKAESDSSTLSISTRRRLMLRPQSSLDSGQEMLKMEIKSNSSKPELTRSSSLDLETTYKLTSSYSTLIDSTCPSHESFSSDFGGSPTLHRYYHVFKKGELDTLIQNYVQNLHVISSFYDHANWCIIAEKVQVWTI